MTYCISDIHGEYDLFMRLLDKIGYEDDDTLMVCGDFIDKGTGSLKVAKTLFDLPNAYCLMGNHEHMFFKFYRARMHSAVMDFDVILRHLQGYFPKDGALLDWDMVDRFAELPAYIERDDFICVHAGVPLDIHNRLLPLDEVDEEIMIYDRRFKEPSLLPLDAPCVFFGHTPSTAVNGRPEIIAYPKASRLAHSPCISDYAKIHLDTGAYATGVMGCFCVEECLSYYVNK